MFRDPCCFSVASAGECSMRSTPYPGMFGWYSDSRQRCLAAASSLGASDCCYGWSDFVYAPAQALPEFSRLLSEPAFLAVFHEVAVPTVINMIVRRSAARWRLLPRCQGSSMAARVNGVQLAQIRHCAHRLDLKDERHRTALRSLLEI